MTEPAFGKLRAIKAEDLRKIIPGDGARVTISGECLRRHWKEIRDQELSIQPPAGAEE